SRVRGRAFSRARGAGRGDVRRSYAAGASESRCAAARAVEARASGNGSEPRKRIACRNARARGRPERGALRARLQASYGEVASPVPDRDAARTGAHGFARRATGSGRGGVPFRFRGPGALHATVSPAVRNHAWPDAEARTFGVVCSELHGIEQAQPLTEVA